MIAPYQGDAPNAVKINLLGEAQNWRCAYCGIRCDGGQNAHDAATRDHIVPKVSKKFAENDGWENEVMACSLCNNNRGAMHSLKYYSKVKKLGRDEAARWARKRHRRRYRAWLARKMAAEISTIAVSAA